MAAKEIVATSESLTTQPSAITAWRTADEIKAMRSLVVQVMREVMKENVHYGIIPGCDKPSLWKPGAEILFSTFRISADPVITNLSTADEVRYQVMVYATSASGQPLGSSVGECSSSEDKYKWRKAVCSEEWEQLPDTRRRLKWKRGQKGFYQVQQVRAEIADCANTVLKMALKRAFVGLALQVTAASDVFTQGIEDLPEEIREEMVADEYVQETAPKNDSLPTEIRRKSPQATSASRPSSNGSGDRPSSAVGTEGRTANPAPSVSRKPAPTVQSPRAPQVRVISEPQARRFYAIWKGAGKTKEEVDRYLHEELRVQSDREIPADRYNEACTWAEKW